MSRNKLYIFLSVSCLAGYAWIALSSLTDVQGICVIKHFTNIPCPSCGSTRSMLSLIHGDISGSLFWNPFGLMLSLLLVILPFWILFDVISGKTSLLTFYNNAETFLKNRYIAIPAIFIILANWAWNIYKGL